MVLGTNSGATVEPQAVVWIGLVEVRPERGNDLLGDALGAYVNVLSKVRGESEYKRFVTDALSANRFRIVAISDAEPLALRREKHAVDKELKALASEVQSVGDVRCGEFFTYASLAHSEQQRRQLHASKHSQQTGSARRRRSSRTSGKKRGIY